MSYINLKKIEAILGEKSSPSHEESSSAIEKALQGSGLSHEDVAVLLNTNDPLLVSQMFEAASQIKQRIYGNRIVLFAPLYVTNHCANNCIYCGFRRDNTLLERKALDMGEVEKETLALLRQGHKRILLVAGEHPKTSNMDYLEQSIETVYATTLGKEMIRRLNVNVAPLSKADFERLKKTGIGTYQLFQETYHEPTYSVVHPSGPKADFERRLLATDDAMRAGIDDIGIGALLGLYDHRFEVLAMISHIRHLEESFGCGPHTISVPRIKPAFNTPYASNPAHSVDDEEFKKIIAILRMAVPYTGIILSTRESSVLRDAAIRLGVSQISAGSSTVPGGYNKSGEDGQFDVTDTRTLSEMIGELVKQGMIPSFCTACYRSGRTGTNFMSLAKPGKIHEFCQQNAFITFYEYLLDHAENGLMEAGRKMIERDIVKLPEQQRRHVSAKLEQLTAGRRDLRV